MNQIGGKKVSIFNKIFNKGSKDAKDPVVNNLDEAVQQDGEKSNEEVLNEESSKEEILNEEALEKETLKQDAIEETPVQKEEESQKEEELLKEKPQGLFAKLFNGLAKTRNSILSGVDNVIHSFKRIDEDLFEELEEVLIMADFGVDTTQKIIEKLREEVKSKKITDPLELKDTLKYIIRDILTVQQTEDILDIEKPVVMLVIGVNGAGKTTTIGKMAYWMKQNNKKVLVAAADTFRAAAIDQLQVWTDRAGVEIVKHNEGSDPASVIYDAIAAAKSRKVDVLICDTAGRLQNKTNLMKELEKISRIIEREYPEAYKEVLIVLDATTGQNAVQQVKLFKEITNLNGIVLTKLDGTAKGGAIVGIYSSMGIPVKYIGVGEKIDDLQKFDPEEFANALLNENK